MVGRRANAAPDPVAGHFLYDKQGRLPPAASGTMRERKHTIEAEVSILEEK